MIPQHRQPTHPGQILLHEFLEPLGITQQDFAAQLGVPLQRINEIIRGRRAVSAGTAWLLAGAFGTSPEFWLNLQGAYDLAKTRPAGTRMTRKQIEQKLWLIRCLLRTQDGLSPLTELRVLDGLYVIEIGQITLSFLATEEGYRQATQFLGTGEAAALGKAA